MCLISLCLFCIFRCAIQSGCAPLQSPAGWMNTAGRREWSFLNGGGGIHTAVRGKIDPEELTLSTGHMRGTYLSLSLFFFLVDLEKNIFKIVHIHQQKNMYICRTYFFNLCTLLLLNACRHYLEARSLNQRLMFWEGHNMDIAYEEDSRESFAKDRDRDWHHYSKSSGRSGRSGRSRRSSHRHRDRRHRRSHSRHRSASV